MEQDEKQADKIVMHGNADVGNWQMPVIRVEKTVEVQDGNMVRITGRDSHGQYKQRKVAGQATSITDYAIPAGTSFTIETSQDGIAWKTIELVASGNAAPANELPPDGVPATRPLTRASVAAPGQMFRIRLPQGVIVEDAYRSPKVEKAEFSYDAAQGVLTAEISTATVTNDNWVVREMKFSEAKQ